MRTGAGAGQRFSKKHEPYADSASSWTVLRYKKCRPKNIAVMKDG